MLFATFRFCSHVSCKVISDDKCCLCFFPRRLETQKPPCESQSRNIMNPPGKSTTCSWPESPDVGASSFFCTMPVFAGDLFYLLGFMCFSHFCSCDLLYVLVFADWCMKKDSLQCNEDISSSRTWLKNITGMQRQMAVTRELKQFGSPYDVILRYDGSSVASC